MKVMNSQLIKSVQTASEDFKEVTKKLDALKKAANTQ